MLRTSTIVLNPTVEDQRELQELAEASSILWNTANYERRKAFFEHVKIPTYSAQCRSLKTLDAFKALGTCKAQALLQKLDESWRSFWALVRLRKKGQLPAHIKKVSPPNYWKSNGERVLKGL
ncbi:MAG: RNA-guided endonuclease TnpB family protein, partial [Nitrososphaerales archaeon]